MVSLAQLVIPIIAAAVLVFIASSLVHMVLKWHMSDYHGFANEDAVRATLNASSPPPGQYFVPYCRDPKELQKPEIRQKFIEGPIAHVTFRPPGPPTMGKQLGSWFVLNLVIATVAGYLAARSLPPGASFLGVCRIVGLATFMAYGTGAVLQSIWWGKPWSSTVKELADAFIYGAVSAVAFAWLWPK